MSAASPQAGRSGRGNATRGRSATSPAFLPWVPQMVALYAAFAAFGLILLIVGYAIVANEVVYDDQEPGITIAMAGALVALAAGSFFLLAGRRAVPQRRVAVLGLVP